MVNLRVLQDQGTRNRVEGSGRCEVRRAIFKRGPSGIYVRAMLCGANHSSNISLGEAMIRGMDEGGAE